MAIRVTPEEKESIDRVRVVSRPEQSRNGENICLFSLLQLKAMGFSEGMAIQAFFACDKNEHLAADFLLKQDKDED